MKFFYRLLLNIINLLLIIIVVVSSVYLISHTQNLIIKGVLIILALCIVFSLFWISETIDSYSFGVSNSKFYLNNILSKDNLIVSLILGIISVLVLITYLLIK